MRPLPGGLLRLEHVVQRELRRLRRLDGAALFVQPGPERRDLQRLRDVLPGWLSRRESDHDRELRVVRGFDRHTGDLRAELSALTAPNSSGTRRRGRGCRAAVARTRRTSRQRCL